MTVSAVQETRSLQQSGRPMLTVDISDMKVSTNPEEILVTYSLGSCVGVVLYDPVVRVGGMIHCMLPLSRIDPEKAALKPHMFVDTGLSALLRAVYERGARKKDLIARVAGAGSPLGQEKIFKIGQRNYTVVRKVLWKNNIMIASENVGGPEARTLFMDMATGRTLVKSGGREVEL
ncbi:MAG TPA: chemotaxis protein CheD [Candidatus Krumholzibacteria bacterium]|nr:chemotaxis protein CheD [Candidatus Krumholzibacteria bacterium]HRX49940.1 chemotaxis protein CheD [Candidatus Krumholzibacteria bacterium]